MKLAADFRYIAREALRGKWGIAVIAGLIASLLGALGSDGPEVKLNIDMAEGANVSFEYAGQTILSTSGGINDQLSTVLVGSAIYIAIAAILLAAVYFVLGSVIEAGYARFNMNLVDRAEANIESLFTYFSIWKTTAATRFLKTLYCFLWSLLFIIPGIIASYSYAMTGYILAEHPELTASEAIARSKEMMSGNRFRLFCLHLSFIGWAILCAFTFGIGNLWLTPYRQVAAAAFYREVSGTEQTVGEEYHDETI